VAIVPAARHLLRAKDLADARYFEPLTVGSFTVSFRRVLGMTPLAYRAAYPPAEQHLRIPRCVALAFGRPRNRTFREDSAAAAS
jgi:hypothetical protein